MLSMCIRSSAWSVFFMEHSYGVDKLTVDLGIVLVQVLPCVVRYYCIRKKTHFFAKMGMDSQFHTGFLLASILLPHYSRVASIKMLANKIVLQVDHLSGCLSCKLEKDLQVVRAIKGRVNGDLSSTLVP